MAERESVFPRWIHWAMKPTRFSSERSTRLQVGSKPVIHRPLWVSDENDFGWREWCTYEEFMTENLKYAYEITFKPGPRVLTLATKDQLLEFGRVFQATDEQIGLMSDGGGHPVDTSTYRSLFLDWQKIADKFDAVLITPFQPELHFMDGRVRWYYGWDCASGVVLDCRCIASWVDVTEELIATPVKSKGY